MNSNLTNQFIEDIYQFSRRNFSIHLVHQAKRCLIDYLGATNSGAYMIKDRGNKLIDYLGDPDGTIPVIGFNRSSGIENATFVNGISSHAAELDDGVISGIVHPGSPLFSALLSVANKEKIDPDAFFKGVITGYEVAVRLAEAVQPSHKQLGFHATATCGAAGTALAIAVMMGFTKEQMKNALSAVLVSAYGTLKVLEDSSELKPFNAGRAAHAGLISISMAITGFKGPDDVLNGGKGFLKMMSKSHDISKLRSKDNDKYGIEKVYFKPYAACRYCHPAIDAALILKNRTSFSSDEIQQINVRSYDLAVKHHDHTIIENVSSAKMSIPFSVAVALKTGRAGMDEFSAEYIQDVEITSITQKVSVTSDETYTSLFPQKSVGSVEIVTKGGESVMEKVEYPKGEPENPLSDEELIEKFSLLMKYAGKSDHHHEKVITCVFDLENKLEDLYMLL